jgi:stage V sporulation protein R
MVINSTPSLAYLMRDNSLLLQVLTIAHVYGHNDFFKNNFTFSRLARGTIGLFKAQPTECAPTWRPSIGPTGPRTSRRRARAFAQRRRNLAVRKLTPEEREQPRQRPTGARSFKRCTAGRTTSNPTPEGPARPS